MDHKIVPYDAETVGVMMRRFFDSSSSVTFQVERQSVGFRIGGQQRPLLNRIIIDTGRFPTAGEALTWLARRQVRLDFVKDHLDTISERIFIETLRTSLVTFLTLKRIALIKSALNPIESEILERLLNALKSTEKESDREVNNGMVNLYGLLRDRKLYNLWLLETRAQTETYRKREKDACLSATFALDSFFDASDLSFLREMIEAPFNNGGISNGHCEFHRLESNQVSVYMDQIIDRDKLFNLRPVAGEVRRLSRAQPFEELNQEIQKDPTRSIETGREIAIASRVKPSQENFARLSAQTSETRLDFTYLLHDGVIRDICHPNPFVQEYAFRLILDAFGIDPTTDPTFVVQRTINYAGAPGKIGRYFILPACANRSGTLALFLSDENEPLPFCWYCAGDEGEMRRLIHEKTLPPNHAEMETPEEMRSAPLEPLPLATTPNPFQSYQWFDPEAICAHIGRRQWAAQFVKMARTLSKLA